MCDKIDKNKESKYTVGSLKVEIYFWTALSGILYYIAGAALILNLQGIENIFWFVNFWWVFFLQLLGTFRIWWVISAKLKL